MSRQSGSKPKHARPVASVAAPAAVSEITLLDRLAILASILLTLEQSATATATDPSGSVAQVSIEPATAESSAAAATAANPPPALEFARLGDSPSTDGHSKDGLRSPDSAEQRLAAEAGQDPNLPILAPPADAAVKPIVPHGSSTSPTLLKIDVVDDKAGSAALSLEKLVAATPLSDIIISQIPATNFAFHGPAGANNFDVFVATGQGNTVDFSGLTGLLAPSTPQQGAAGATTKHDTSAPNGVFVDLTANSQTVETAIGAVTVQAWQLDADGKAVIPLAHLETNDNMFGTFGNDIIVGNGNANRFTYTAHDGSEDGHSASYGFDIYYGGPRTGSAADDLGDSVQFSRLGTQEALAAGFDQIQLPYHAKGITVDLGQSVTIASIDPQTGEAAVVTGSLVSTIGGSEQMDLALLAWTTEPEDGNAYSSIEQIVGSGGSDVIRGDAAANTYVVVTAGENGASVFDGRGGSDSIDFSHVGPAADAMQGNHIATTVTETGTSDAHAAPEASAGTELVVGNGVYVNLASTEHSADSSQGTVSVQAWTIGGDGAAGTALAHLESVETVIGTVGGDVMVGNAEANTFIYTAADDARPDVAGQIATGPAASYGFDIYYGAEAASGHAWDGHDTADFSALGSQASVAAALAEGVESTLLPHNATGITVDLAQAVKLTTIDPETGDHVAVTGSVVSTVGGSEQSQLALLAWSAPADGSEGQATIENIVTSGGADAIWGNEAENIVVVTGTGSDGPVFFDGRGGSDTVDFSQLSRSGSTSGIEIHLNQTNDNVADPTGALQSDVIQVSLLSQDQDAAVTPDNGSQVAQLKNVENVIGSGGADIIEGNSNDNVLAGGGGSDTFVFADVAVVDGRGVTQIGHDIIRDFRQGGIDDNDLLVFDSKIFNFHDGSNLDWLQQLLSNNQIRNDDQGVIIWIDDNNSITLQNYDLDDQSGHALGLSAYASWIVFV